MDKIGGACGTYGIEENCIITRFLVWKPGGKSPLGRPGHKWKLILKRH
jgi:hypothetical protein